MAWTFVRHLGREQDGYGVWWVRSVWQNGLGGERCERGKWPESPSDEQIANHLNSLAAMLNMPVSEPGPIPIPGNGDPLPIPGNGDPLPIPEGDESPPHGGY